MGQSFPLHFCIVLTYIINELNNYWGLLLQTFLYQPLARRAEWIFFSKKRVLFERFRDRWKEQTNIETFKQKETICYKLNPLFLYCFLFFLYDPLTASLHGFKKSIIHGAV